MRYPLLLACPIVLAAACEEPEWWTSPDCIGVENNGATYELSVGDQFCVNLGMSGGIMGRNPVSRYDETIVKRTDRYDNQSEDCCDDASGTVWERFFVLDDGQTPLRLCNGEYSDCTVPYFEITVRVR